MDLFKKGLAFGLGLAVASKEQVKKFVDELVKQGEISIEESKEVFNQLIKRGEEEKTELQRLVREQVAQVINKLDIATKEDIRELEEKIRKLEKEDE